MKIRKGQKGIMAFLRENKSGWHIFYDGKNVAYLDMSVSEIFGLMTEFAAGDYEFVNWAGNCLFFDTINNA